MKIDMFSAFGSMFSPVGSFLGKLVFIALLCLVSFVLIFLLSFSIKYKINLFRLDVKALSNPYVTFKYHDLFRWVLVDFLRRKDFYGEFKEYGFTFYVGRQGSGKTISMIHYLEKMRVLYPDCIIVTNFKYSETDFIMKDWRDILYVRNGTKGVIFAIDEIQGEYNSNDWKNFPETLLSEISQQRKQRIKIVATSQFYTRVAKPLREQANTVVCCTTFAGRLTKNREYDALEYATSIDNPISIKKKMKPVSKSSFVQSDSLRSIYDTYEKIERMKKIDFIPRAER